MSSLVCDSCDPSNSQDELLQQLRTNHLIITWIQQWNFREVKSLNKSYPGCVWSTRLEWLCEITLVCLTWEFRWRDVLSVLVGKVLECLQAAAEAQDDSRWDTTIWQVYIQTLYYNFKKMSKYKWRCRFSSTTLCKLQLDLPDVFVLKSSICCWTSPGLKWEASPDG